MWLKWARQKSIHPWVLRYIEQRPDHLFSEPPKLEEPFSTPSSWEILSDALHEYHAGKEEIKDRTLQMMAYACLSPKHASMFLAFTKQVQNGNLLEDIMAGKSRWPSRPEERDVLYFISQSFRARLLEELPKNKQNMSGDRLSDIYRYKAIIKELASVNLELAQMVVARDESGRELPAWFMTEVIRDLPRLIGGDAK
ncbi:MAG: hypothetical protein Q4D60_11025 [Eubacteriales bacterium]|nr:hypothetical protein [Eubacteriales bacterium]